MAEALVITRWFRKIDNVAIMRQRDALLKATAEKYAAKARQLSAVPKGHGTGRKSGKLQAAITVSETYLSESGKSVKIDIKVDTSPDKAPYASYQEEGTGWYSKNPHWIYPRNKRVMKWEQAKGGKLPGAYRRMIPQARVTARWGIPGSRGRIKERREYAPIYTQYASRVRGVMPKHYMRDARNDKTIRAEHRAGMQKIAQEIKRQITTTGAPL